MFHSIAQGAITARQRRCSSDGMSGDKSDARRTPNCAQTPLSHSFGRARPRFGKCVDSRICEDVAQKVLEHDLGVPILGELRGLGERLPRCFDNDAERAGAVFV